MKKIKLPIYNNERIIILNTLNEFRNYFIVYNIWLIITKD